MKMIQLKKVNITPRQAEILELVRKKEKAGNKEIKKRLESVWGEVSRVTVARETEKMVKAGFLLREGKGRNVLYKEKETNPLFRSFDVEKYFKIDPDRRKAVLERFNFKIFDYFSQGLLSEAEKEKLEKLNEGCQRRIEKLSPAVLKREFERLTVELSWKSSQIEGNTYTLIDTEILIKEHKEAKGHSKDEAVMILNHKKAVDYILDKRNDFGKLTLPKIENIHQLIIEGLGVERNIRKRPVGVTGTKYRPLDNQFQIREALEKVCLVVNSGKLSPLEKSLAAIVLISYIQPFEDGNKRTARILGDAILWTNNFCPLSYRSIDESDYKKATLLFYEQNSISLFKELFIEQFKFAVDDYFLG